MEYAITAKTTDYWKKTSAKNLSAAKATATREFPDSNDQSVAEIHNGQYFTVSEKRNGKWEYCRAY